MPFIISLQKPCLKGINKRKKLGLSSAWEKQPTFRDPITGFPAKWCLRNYCRNSILMTCTTQLLLIGRARREILFNQSEALPRSGYWHVISMEFRLNFCSHFAGKPVIESQNVGWFFPFLLFWLPNLHLTFHGLNLFMG